MPVFLLQYARSNPMDSTHKRTRSQTRKSPFMIPKKCGARKFHFWSPLKKIIDNPSFFQKSISVLLVAVRLFSFRPGKVSPTADKNNFSGRKISIQRFRICIQSLCIHIRKLRLYIRNLWIKNWIMAFQLFRTAEKTFSGRERLFLLLLWPVPWILPPPTNECSGKVSASAKASVQHRILSHLCINLPGKHPFEYAYRGAGIWFVVAVG